MKRDSRQWQQRSLSPMPPHLRASTSPRQLPPPRLQAAPQACIVAGDGGSSVRSALAGNHAHQSCVQLRASDGKADDTALRHGRLSRVDSWSSSHSRGPLPRCPSTTPILPLPAAALLSCAGGFDGRKRRCSR